MTPTMAAIWAISTLPLMTVWILERKKWLPVATLLSSAIAVTGEGILYIAVNLFLIMAISYLAHTLIDDDDVDKQSIS